MVPTAPSKLEAEFALQLRAHGVMPSTREYRPIPTRRYRIDFAWPKEKIGVELDGGTWKNGRHSRGKGYDADCEKLALLQLDGWTIFKATETHLKNGMAIEWTKQALGL
jgi:very-short-patch-repair endonuclease